MLFSNLVNPCTSMGIDASAPRCASNCESFHAVMASNLSSIELVVRAPTLSRSGTEPSREPKFEEWSGNIGHICVLCIIKQARVSHESRWETTQLGCRHLDKTKPEKLVTQNNHTHVRTGNGLSQNSCGREFQVFPAQHALESTTSSLSSSFIPDGAGDTIRWLVRRK